MRVKRPAVLLVAAAAGSALAHSAAPGPDPASLWNAWSSQAWLWLLWLLPGLLVLGGIARMWRQAGRTAGVPPARAACFAAGWLFLGLALLSPLDAAGGQLFWAHMLQHEVVMLAAAPLLVLGRPLAPMLWGLPARWRPAAAHAARRLGLPRLVRALTPLPAAWCLHAASLWAWHVPALFEAALRLQVLHDLQHVTFFVGALAFWWSLFEGRGGRERMGAAVLYLFTTLLHTSVLGALLTFSPRAWYLPYESSAPAWGLSALEDQQLGGLIMWVPGGVVYLAAALALLGLMLRERPARAMVGVPR